MDVPAFSMSNPAVAGKISRKKTLALDDFLFCKTGWVRASLHPTMTEQEVTFIADAIKDVTSNVNH